MKLEELDTSVILDMLESFVELDMLESSTGLAAELVDNSCGVPVRGAGVTEEPPDVQSVILD